MRDERMRPAGLVLVMAALAATLASPAAAKDGRGIYMRNCAACHGPEGKGDGLASTFLNEFVDKKCPWVHVDLSAISRKGGLAHIPSEITGFGIRFSTSLILDKQLTGTAH